MSTSPKPIAPNPRPIHPGVSIGYVHLKVADLNRAIAFYCGVLGFDLMQRYGHEAAFLSAGGYHHHIAYFAIRYPTRAALADALRRLMDAGIAIEGKRPRGQ
jgi:catechol 2,3-dioxygenase